MMRLVAIKTLTSSRISTSMQDQKSCSRELRFSVNKWTNCSKQLRSKTKNFNLNKMHTKQWMRQLCSSKSWYQTWLKRKRLRRTGLMSIKKESSSCLDKLTRRIQLLRCGSRISERYSTWKWSDLSKSATKTVNSTKWSSNCTRL